MKFEFVHCILKWKIGVLINLSVWVILKTEECWKVCCVFAFVKILFVFIFRSLRYVSFLLLYDYSGFYLKLIWCFLLNQIHDFIILWRCGSIFGVLMYVLPVVSILWNTYRCIFLAGFIYHSYIKINFFFLGFRKFWD